MVAFAAFMAALMWIIGWAAVIILFGVNGLLVAGVLHFVLVFGCFFWYAVLSA